MTKGDNDMDNCYKIKTESLYERPTELDWLTDEYENITIYNHCVEISVYTFGDYLELKKLLTECCIEFTTNL